ncbi:MAG TPA: hypothetical protein PKD09_16390 [Aggregatilinea sp.]|uniref:hypothetical protein n=1 Tax=Aggregatilinea sp. TaxID=2806333 RepID=UPI002B79C0E4|nr:hypothetical protein [Aggregatilinea sp.]HML23235.1 hypothetical protein [Aggregatilinea sp.]
MSENFTVDRAAELWDDFARQFMQINPGIHFTTAQSPEEREAVYRARFAEVIRNGWAQPADMPDGLERDDYDERALHLVGWRDGQRAIVGRLVFPSPGRPLPTEAAYNLEIEPHQQVVDTGRGILLRDDPREAQHELFLGLMSFAWQESRKRGFSYACAAMTASMLRLYRMMGIHWDVLGDPRLYWGEMRYPCRSDVVKTVQSFLARGAS